MRKLTLSMVAVLCIVLLPAAAQAGNGEVTGACFAVEVEPVEPAGVVGFAGCADGFTALQCAAVGEILTEFAPGETCEGVAGEGGWSWDGSCEFTYSSFGDVCAQLYSVQGPITSAGFCANDVAGSWTDGGTCGAPVPTMPPVGLAALMLLMLAGALFFMAKKSPQTTF